MELDARAFLAGLFEGEAGTQHDIDRLGALEVVTTIEPPRPTPDLTVADIGGVTGESNADMDSHDWTEREIADGWIVERADVAGCEIIDIPKPCPDCGGIVFWWDVAGGAHCGACSPRTPTGERLRRLAAELRRQHPATRHDAPLPRSVTVSSTTAPTKLIFYARTQNGTRPILERASACYFRRKDWSHGRETVASISA